MSNESSKPVNPKTAGAAEPQKPVATAAVLSPPRPLLTTAPSSGGRTHLSHGPTEEQVIRGVKEHGEG